MTYDCKCNVMGLKWARNWSCYFLTGMRRLGFSFSIRRAFARHVLSVAPSAIASCARSGHQIAPRGFFFGTRIRVAMLASEEWRVKGEFVAAARRGGKVVLRAHDQKSSVQTETKWPEI